MLVRDYYPIHLLFLAGSNHAEAMVTSSLDYLIVTYMMLAGLRVHEHY